MLHFKVIVQIHAFLATGIQNIKQVPRLDDYEAASSTTGNVLLTALLADQIECNNDMLSSSIEEIRETCTAGGENWRKNIKAIAYGVNLTNMVGQV